MNNYNRTGLKFIESLILLLLIYYYMCNVLCKYCPCLICCEYGTRRKQDCGFVESFEGKESLGRLFSFAHVQVGW